MEMNLQNLALESAKFGTVTDIVMDRTNPKIQGQVYKESISSYIKLPKEIPLFLEVEGLSLRYTNQNLSQERISH